MSKVGRMFSQLLSTLISVGEPLDDDVIDDAMQDAKDAQELYDGGYVREVDESRPKSMWLRRE